MTTSTSSPRLYVGTYAKYNAGSIKGAWLDLENYSDKEAFLKACATLHADEHDPEFMFQDFEGFPRALYSESSVSEKIWDWIELDEDDRELLAVYQDNIDADGTIETARDCFAGHAETKADFAEQWLVDTDGLAGVPDHLKNYIDYESYARDMETTGGEVSFVRHDGQLWVFNSNR